MSNHLVGRIHLSFFVALAIRGIYEQMPFVYLMQVGEYVR